MKCIASKQVTYCATSLITATGILTKQLYVYTKNEAWIAVAAGFAVSFFVMLMYSALARKYPGLSLIEINDNVFGRFIGKIFSGLYIFFFFTIACLNINIVGGFVNSFVLPNTPTVLILAAFTCVCAWAVHKGPHNLLSYSVFLAVVSIVVILVNTFLLIPKMDLKNLLPVFSLPIADYMIGTHSIAILPLCDPFVMLMFLPYMQKPEEFGKALIKGNVIGTLVLLILVLRDTLVLGSGTEIYSYPALIAVRQIDIGDVITRMDIIYVSILIILMFYKVVVMYYATIDGIQRILGFRSGNFLVNIIGVFLVVYALMAFRSSREHSEWLISGAAIVHDTFFVVVLPVVTLATALCRRLFKKEDNAENQAASQK